MLHAFRKHSDFGEETLIGWAGHDLMWIPLGAAVGPYYHYGWAEILDKMPTSTCDSKNVCVCTDIPENLEGGVMLE